MRTLYLVSCVSKKLPHPAEARDLYVSQWFKSARRYVEDTGNDWCILSARHGLVVPTDVLEPYEDTLNTKSSHARWTWAHKVLFQLKDRYGYATFDRYVLLAGRRYAEHLAPVLQAELPLKGLGIGQQLAWFKRHTHAKAA